MLGDVPGAGFLAHVAASCALFCLFLPLQLAFGLLVGQLAVEQAVKEP